MAALHWILFCRVVDNFGDIGVCWRLAADLAARGDAVRLVADDLSALRWMAPGGADGVTVQAWPGAERAQELQTLATACGRADVVVEAFGCDPPAACVATMAAAPRAPVWLNLEYLSAEAYVARSHGLPSPQRNGLVKWFFFPGFTDASGGLLREPGLAAARAAFDRQHARQRLGLAAQPGERVVTLFCYDNPALDALLGSLAAAPTLLALTPGPAQRQVTRVPGAVRLLRLPWLAQRDFDQLLWASDLNFVRGEDSLVRALWAGAPFVWQAYPQQDGAHFAKVEALLAGSALPADVQRLWRAWNGAPGLAWPGLPDPSHGGEWPRAQARWSADLWNRDDLATRLRHFALGKARASG